METAKRDAEQIQSNQSQSLHRMQTNRSTEKAELGMKDDRYTRDQKKPYNSPSSKQEDKGGPELCVSPVASQIIQERDASFTVPIVSGVANKEFEEVFSEGIGTVRNMHANIAIKDDAKPKFCNVRPIPYAIKAKVERS
ncbi:Pol polyprotein [Biomphalaria glabrata]|nr:Biomphalaria glabrata DNA excision repair protein ERCC-8-like; transcript variant X4 [Biomphalaria glabrata]